MFDSACIGGALSMKQPVGVIAARCRADITVLDPEHPALAGRENDAALDTWIFSAGNAAVKDVFVGGRHVVKDGRHFDQETIEARFRAAIRRLSA